MRRVILNRAPELAAELVRLKVDILVVAGGIRLIRAAKEATKRFLSSIAGVWIRSCEEASLKALPVPAEISPDYQPYAEN